MVEIITVVFDEYYMEERERIAQEATDLGMVVAPDSLYHNMFQGTFEVDNLDQLFGIEGVVFACPERTIVAALYDPDTGEVYDA